MDVGLQSGLARPAGGVGAMARLSGDALAAFVEASCARHGVPVKVTDPGVVRDVAVLLTGRAGPGGVSRTVGRPVSDSPDQIDAVGVESSATVRGGGDDDAVEDGFDDRGLAGEVQLRPVDT